MWGRATGQTRGSWKLLKKEHAKPLNDRILILAPCHDWSRDHSLKPEPRPSAPPRSAKTKDSLNRPAAICWRAAEEAPSLATQMTKHLVYILGLCTLTCEVTENMKDNEERTIWHSYAD
eukprot:TRINITY_DN24452_c0_g1_i1.p1 TRINITY_DN24452_c0_g1~~TRINITY_DN24452_c0_g1_i1.p1  ORF type:complete len:119 (+),score=14.29 TRINITY_DN24452_c0_g1_i1:18-374(+)